MRRIGNGGNDTEFLKLHADVLVIGRENAKRTDVHRKNGIIVNEGRVLLSILSRVDNMTPQEVKQRRMYNLKKYGLSNEEIDKVVIPVLSEKQTSEVFDKRTNKQLEREQLLSRLAVLRSALQYLQKGSPDVSALSVPDAVGNDECKEAKGGRKEKAKKHVRLGLVIGQRRRYFRFGLFVDAEETESEAKRIGSGV